MGLAFRKALFDCLRSHTHEAGFDAPVARVTSADSYVPLGPAADAVLLQEAESLAAAHRLLRR